MANSVIRIHKENPRTWKRVGAGFETLSKSGYWANYVLELEKLADKVVKYLHGYFRRPRGKVRPRLGIKDRQAIEDPEVQNTLLKGYEATFLNLRPKSGLVGNRFVNSGLTSNIGFTVSHRREGTIFKVRQMLRVLNSGYHANWVQRSKFGKRMLVPVIDSDTGKLRAAPLEQVKHRKGDAATHFFDRTMEKAEGHWQDHLRQAKYRMLDAMQNPNISK